jgi:hypothetical protein
MNKLGLLAAAAVFVIATVQAKEIHKTFPLTLDGHVHVDTFKGEVRVTTWDRPEAEVSVRVDPDGSSTADIDAVERTEIRMSATPASLHLKTDYRQLEHHIRNVHMPFARYEIHMPRTAHLQIKDYKSEIDVAGIAAPVEIETYKGETRLRGLSGPLRMNTYKGHGTFEFAQFAGPSTIETYKGTFDISIPQNTGFELVSRNSGRSSIRSAFDYTLPAGTYGRFNNEHFQVHVNGGGPELVLKSYRGEFNLH